MRLFQRNNRNHDNDVSTPVVNSQDFQQQAESLIPAEVRMISGCHSEQTSADVSNVNAVATLPNPAGRAGGACTSALLEILYRHAKQPTNLTFQDLLLELRDSLAKTGMSQIPQLTSSRPLELQKTPFSLVGNGSGRRRALLVGINYKGQSGQLSGCWNDVFNVKQYLVNEHQFSEHDVTVLVDDDRHLLPTRQKIMAALQQLVAQSVAGDSVYFHYSGHGGLLSPQGNAFKNTQNNHDETLYPVDHERSGQIRDFSLFNHFVKPMAAGVTVTCVMDCCHSGAVLDLPYSFLPTPGGTIRMRENMSSLSNLAFLYILAGGILPPGFGSVTENIENTVDGDLDDYHGTGVEEMEADTMDTSYFQDSGGEMTSPEYGDGYQAAGPVQGVEPDAFGPGVPLVQGIEPTPEIVQGVAVPDTGDYGDYGGVGDYNDGGAGEYNYDSSGEEAAGDCGCGDILSALMDQDL